ncbi:hypothetical protein GQR58_005502 [Nymphon striatum]|nr:hypothetical protein GQR58_005502 [Nymphon striatum]
MLRRQRPPIKGLGEWALAYRKSRKGESTLLPTRRARPAVCSRRQQSSNGKDGGSIGNLGGLPFFLTLGDSVSRTHVIFKSFKLFPSYLFFGILKKLILILKKMLITCVKSNDTTNTVEDLKFTGILQNDLNCYIAPSGFLSPNRALSALRVMVLTAISTVRRSFAFSVVVIAMSTSATYVFIFTGTLVMAKFLALKATKRIWNKLLYVHIQVAGLYGTGTPMLCAIANHYSIKELIEGGADINLPSRKKEDDSSTSLLPAASLMVGEGSSNYGTTNEEENRMDDAYSNHETEDDEPVSEDNEDVTMDESDNNEDAHNLAHSEDEFRSRSDDDEAKVKEKDLRECLGSSHLLNELCNKKIHLFVPLESYDEKHPIITPKEIPIATTLVQYFHRKVEHQGRGITQNAIRTSGIWITGASSLVRSVISKCVICRRLRGGRQMQKMGNLPNDRIDVYGLAPLVYCAVDCFGPFIVRQRRSDLKRYGVIFNCLQSRAIHLEVAHSLVTDSFLNAYRRFVCRRGPIWQLRCDRSTNFVGAEGELVKALKEMDNDRIRQELLKDDYDWIKFEFNVPGASHMAGAWERMIRSVRSVLSSLLHRHGSKLDDEGLSTLMTEVESIVNGLPITVGTLNLATCPHPLLPSQLLNMKPGILLPPPGNFQRADIYLRKRWRKVQHITTEFWNIWRKDYLQSLQNRAKWTVKHRNIRMDMDNRGYGYG